MSNSIDLHRALRGDYDVISYTVKRYTVRIMHLPQGYRVTQQRDGELTYVSDAYKDYEAASYIAGVCIGNIETLLGGAHDN
jgi:hypothetical protein